MIAGVTLNIFNNHADRVRGANLAQAINVLQSVILTEGDAIHARHLNLSFRQTTPAAAVVSPWDQIDLSGTMADALRRVTEEVEHRKILQALQDANGNKTHVADMLNIGYKVLLQKMKAYGVPE